MAYLLLLAFFCSAGFAVLQRKNSDAGWVWTGAYVLLAISLVSQIILAFRLNEDSARLFYLSRFMLAVAWLAAAFLLALFPKEVLVRRLPVTLVFVSLIALTLVGATAISRAEDWFQTTKPVFAQIADLLATNRPTRWLAAGLTAISTSILLGGPLYMLARRKLAGAGAASLITGTLLLVIPILWPPQRADQAFYLQEALIPFLFFFGFQLLEIPASRKQ